VLFLAPPVPPAPTTIEYELPLVTERELAYTTRPPPPPPPKPGDPAPPPPPPTTRTFTEDIPEGAIQVFVEVLTFKTHKVSVDASMTLVVLVKLFEHMVAEAGGVAIALKLPTKKETAATLKINLRTLSPLEARSNLSKFLDGFLI
jgi:hypothetical protein